jgi:23S rRNA pseudouridine1911/1915/1917 synthase
MIVAKTQRAMSTLIVMIKKRKVERNYMAIVFGQPPLNSGTIDAPIGRHTTDRKKMTVNISEHRTRPARTHYRVLTRYTGFALVGCKLDTGRTHQIRVHMSHIGYPVAGDPLYAGRKAHSWVNKVLGNMSKSRSGYEETERILNQVADVITTDQVHLLHAGRLRFPHPVMGNFLSFEAQPHRKFLDVLNLLNQLPDKEVVGEF